MHEIDNTIIKNVLKIVPSNIDHKTHSTSQVLNALSDNIENQFQFDVYILKTHDIFLK